MFRYFYLLVQKTWRLLGYKLPLSFYVIPGKRHKDHGLSGVVNVGYGVYIRVRRNTMLTLDTNIANLIGRCFFLPLSIFCVYVFIRIGQEQPNLTHIVFWKFRAMHLIYFIVLMFVFLVITVLSSLLSTIKVQVDKTADTITFVSFLKRRTIAGSDIENYFVTIHRNAFKEWKGLLLQCKDENTIQLAGQNLKSIGDFEQYLVNKDISCLGEGRMKFPFY